MLPLEYGALLDESLEKIIMTKEFIKGEKPIFVRKSDTMEG